MKRLVFIIAMAAVCSLSFAQGDNSSKLSLTTKMFLSELNDGGFDPVKQAARLKAQRARGEKPIVKHSKNEGRLYAAPDTINGRAFISAFIRLDDSNNTNALEALGVQVQCRFKKGLITANIPVDKLSEVFDLDYVKNVSVAKMMEPQTYVSRELTRTIDVLSLSNQAKELGLKTAYTGKGVLLGIIDQGIDYRHIAFKDVDGNSRIKGSYSYDGNVLYPDNASIPTDCPTEDHGTHTASIAGGSSVIINGETVTVTNNHENATFGGMAPETDLYLCGIHGYYDTYAANSMSFICNYADKHNMPVVVSNSYGGCCGPHDGSGDSNLGEVCNSLFGDDNPNHICLFSSANNANVYANYNEGGGNHVMSEASSNNPLGTIIRKSYYNSELKAYDDAGYYYNSNIACAWARDYCEGGLNCTLYVLDCSNGNILVSIPIVSCDVAVTGLEDYYDGKLTVYYHDDKNKQGFVLYADRLTSKAKSKYTLAFEVAPANGSVTIDMWGGRDCFFTNHLQSEGHTWIAGSDDMSVIDNATIPSVISVGAYIGRNGYNDFQGVFWHDDNMIIGDIASFSSYATANQSPTHEMYPWITAPGVCIASAVNSFNKEGEYLSGKKMSRVNIDDNNPYGVMDGTSMSTPLTAGIVALWLQAANEKGIQLTTSQVKNIMKETADHNGINDDNKKHFGNGKINALKGIEYILNYPTIETSKTSLTFNGEIDETVEQIFHVRMTNVSDKVTVTALLHDPDDVFTIDKPIMVIGTEGVDVKVTWTPKAVGTTTGTITLSTFDEDGMISDVVVNLTGTVLAAPAISVNTNRLTFTTKPHSTSTRTLTVKGYRLREDAVLFLGKNDGVFSINKTDIPAKYLDEPTTVTVSFMPKAAGNYTDTLTIVSGNTARIVIILNGSAGDTGTLAKYEYWFDNEMPGKNFIILNGTQKVIDREIDTEGLTVGVHKLYMRAAQTDGEYSYSPVSTTLFFKRPVGVANQIEYWFDDNRDNVRTVSGTLDGQNYKFISDLNLDDVTPGHHRLYCRPLSDNNMPSGAVTSVPVIVKSLYAGGPKMASYSISVDDEQVASGALPSQQVVDFSYTLDASDLAEGTHELKATFWNSFGVSVTDLTPFWVRGALTGDVNADGQVGIGDIVAITNVMAGIETDPAVVKRADVNGDGQVGIGDIVAITNIMAGVAN